MKKKIIVATVSLLLLGPTETIIGKVMEYRKRAVEVAPVVKEIRVHPEIVVNIPERILRVYNVPNGRKAQDSDSVIYEFPVAIGMPSPKKYQTPELESIILFAERNPVFKPIGEWAGNDRGIAFPFSHPKNAYRARNDSGAFEGYKLTLDYSDIIRIHSTQNEESVRRQQAASHMCLRMLLPDVRLLYNLARKNPRMPVRIEYDIFTLQRNFDGVTIIMHPDVYGREGDVANALYDELLENGYNASSETIERIARHMKDNSFIEAQVLGERVYFNDEQTSFEEASLTSKL
ncbi:MAG: L,D-transpeptidase [Candidatus Woesearchaeota archaeon]